MIIGSPLVSRNQDGILRVICPGRISTPGQDVEAIASTQDECERWLKGVYFGAYKIDRLGEQASGWVADRATIVEARERIKAGSCDVILCGELREVYRNPAFLWGFVHLCVDHCVRFIAFVEGVDTAADDWEIPMHTAVLRHGLASPEARRRVRRKATRSFSQGGMVMKVKFSYRRLTRDEADSGQFGPVGLRIARLPEWTATIRELREQVLRGDGPPALARYLKDAKIPTGPYVTSQTWTPRLVLDLLRDPILSGRRTFRRKVHRMIFGKGTHRSVPNPGQPEVQQYTQLAHMTSDEQDTMLAALDVRRNRTKNLNATPSGQASPNWNRPRSESLWPGQHAVCSVCGGRMYRMGRFLRCQNSVDDRNRICWNCVQVAHETTLPTILRWVVEEVERFPGFREQLVDAAWSHVQLMSRRRQTALTSNRHEISRLRAEAKRLTKSIRMGGRLKSLVRDLTAVEEQLDRMENELCGESQQQQDEGRFMSRESVCSNLFEATLWLARTSLEFAGLLRRLLPRFVIAPVQALDCPQVRPRAFLTLSLEAWATEGESIPASVSTTIDLFNAPVHVQHLNSVLAVREATPGVTYRQIAAALGIGYMTVKRAIAYAGLMTKAGLTDPYRVLTERPVNASRWQRRASRTGKDRPAA